MIKKSVSNPSFVSHTSDEDMALINGFALTPLNKDDIFTFSVILCDNDIDRDFERFSENSLAALEKLFVGKTGILNHSMKSEDQSCRTYKTELISDSTKKTADGKDYVCLKAWCYTVKSEKNDALIRDIQAGIKKEVSISCSSSEKICSVCGTTNCSHIPGRKYNGKLCFKTIEGITDAYEWSFVAVPAQRRAGVTKSFKKEKDMENIIKSIKESKKLTLEENEVKKLRSFIEELEKKSADGEKYRTALCVKAKKNFAVALPSVTEECVDGILKNISSTNLEILCEALEKQATKVIPPVAQLYREDKDNTANSNSQFKF